MTDCFYSLRYESYSSSNISTAQFASFHLRCLCCHQKPTVCKYTSLATTVYSSGILWRFYGLRSMVCLERLLEAGNSQSSCLLRMCDCADVPVHQPCLQLRCRMFHSPPAVFKGLYVLWCRSCSVGQVYVLCCDGMRGPFAHVRQGHEQQHWIGTQPFMQKLDSHVCACLCKSLSSSCIVLCCCASNHQYA